MYKPLRYRKTDKNYQKDFIKNHPFATLIVKEKEFLATHIPVLISADSEELLLYGHIANHNEMLKFMKNGTEVFLIFQGSQGYVSSSWYEEKDISTWDYSAVHLHATVKIQTSEELELSLRNLIQHFEKDMEKPLLYDDIPKETIRKNFQDITGFWLKPTKIEAIAKYHQNFSSTDIQNVTEKLKNSNEDLASAIQKENSKK
ncbi:FMN-binding negative transcriptional regulator [Mesonia maritima]|uniref:Transcriptional regulator n=1 Tax=Mesonia maritima TaxID=1793873 RepID=A0ABU1K8Y6_9FLAO|nr:FMN-binding negative transcriptional regulator [Mesonia maritima]MDR6301776.1 transcriptional regulator [Mesonia maritima]